jgi:cytochrome c oxidase subunit 4
MSYFNLVKGPKPHPHSVWLYWGIFFILVFLTFVTVSLAHYDFGKLNIIVTLLIASTKAILVMAIFMHLAFDNKFYAVIAATSLVFLSLFIGFPILDMKSRGDLDAHNKNYLPRDEAVYKHHIKDPNDLPLRPGLQEAVPDKLIFIGPNEH